MTERSLSDQAAIVGIGQTEFSKNSGRSELQLAAEASLAAIRDAGLDPSDIDGMATFTLDSSDEFDVGASANWRQVMGNSRLAWFLPILGDGPAADGLRPWVGGAWHVPRAQPEFRRLARLDGSRRVRGARRAGFRAR